MKRSTSFLVRVALMAAALALAVVFVGRDADSPAEAVSYNPSFNVSVADPTPGANSDVIVSFSVDAPDSFPNVKTDSTIQFIPRQWGVTPAPVGALGGTFNAQTTLGIGGSACGFPLPVPFMMFEGTTDTSNLSSALDLGAGEGPGGSDLHPGGIGYSGQFAEDPDTVQAPGDLGDPLIQFNADEKSSSLYYTVYDTVYRDVDGSDSISIGDVRFNLTIKSGQWLQPGPVQAGDSDVGDALYPFGDYGDFKHSETVAANGQMDIGETIYWDFGDQWTVSYGDKRMTDLGAIPKGSTVQDSGLSGGITRYPDFLNEMFPPAEVGEPLARQWGGYNVLDLVAVSLNIVTYRPGQLPGYPAQLGYPNVVILLNPVAPVDMANINMTSDLCADLSLVSTNFGVSGDNPNTFEDESGYVRFTNPNGQKDYLFTLVTTSQADADGDGIENMLDSCPFTPNTQDLDGRNNGGDIFGGGAADPDWDFLDGACDPDPDNASPLSPQTWAQDEDQDNYANRADNCSTAGNGTYQSGEKYVQTGQWVFYYSLQTEGIGPSNQDDYDGDDIGDACEGSESGGPGAAPGDQQCMNADDDDGDEVVNDGCPANPIDARGESGPECTNETDDDDDDVVNDGCPAVNNAETGDQCTNATDDDGDDLVNDGCPGVSNEESGDQCNNAADDDFDSVVNDGCPTVNVTGEPESGDQCLNDGDDDGDGLVNDGCPANGAAETGWRCNDALDNEPNWQGGPDGYVNDGCPTNVIRAETGAQCDNDDDDDGDGVVNDGCPQFPSANNESGAQCENAVDDDFDDVVNDGCPKFPANNPESGEQCTNATDDDFDGVVNDGCPMYTKPSVPETGDQCNNAADDDGDGLVNDGCPAVDPDDYAKTHITGEVHVVTLTQGVPIYKHGIKLNNLGGPKQVQAGGAKTYSVPVSNLSDSPEEIQVALRVLEDDCATVNGAPGENTAVVSVGPGGSGSASFTVDWAECPDYEYTLQADACHAGDEDAGFFGVGDCPGESDGMVDNNADDDAPRTKIVTVGSP
jgi:hypothetical protein